jgi:group I intron endonuclease
MHIYKITNKINNKVYVGQTIQQNPRMRWYQHCADARRGKDTHLYNSMRKYGVDHFHWEIIDNAIDVQDLNNKESQWLEFYRDQQETYNIREAGNNKIHSLESIEKMRASQKLRHATTNVGGWKRKDGGPMLGKAHPKKGKPSKKWSDEAKAKLSLIAKEREARKKLAAKEN